MARIVDPPKVRREHGLVVIGCLLIVGHLADHALVRGQETMPFVAMIALTVLAVTLYRRTPTWLRVSVLSIVGVNAIVKGFGHLAHFFGSSVTGADLSGAGELVGGVLLLLVATWELRLRRDASKRTRVAA